MAQAQLLMIILNDPTHLPEILQTWRDVGVPGTTILNSAGGHRTRNLFSLIGLSALTVLVIIAANTLRATTLFYIESGLIATPAWTHDGAGVLMYLLAATAIVWLASKLRASQCPCNA